MTEEEIRTLEFHLVRLLCQGDTDTELREVILARLRGYAFRSVEHQVLFDCIQAMPPDRAELLRELLPARLVRAGFPDFDLAPFVASSGASPGGSTEESPGESHGLSPDEARELCQALTGADPAEGSASAGKQAAGMARGERGPVQ